MKDCRMLAPKPRPYQIHIFLSDEFAAVAARHETIPEMKPLLDVLEKHNAAIVQSRLQQFSRYVESVKKHPEILRHEQAKKLYELTTASLANAEKRGYFARDFEVSMNNKMSFTGNEANALLADLRKLGRDSILTPGKAFRPGHEKRVRPARKVYIPKKHPGME